MAADRMTRILVLRPGAIGDTLVTLPALFAMRERFPGAELSVVGNVQALPLVEAAGCADAWIGFDDPRVTRLFVPAEPAADDPFRGIDVGVAWGRDPDGTLRSALELRGARQVVVAPSRPADGQAVHVARHLLRTLAPLGVDPGAAPRIPRIRLPCAAQEAAGRALSAAGLAGRPFAVIHPGSGSPAKNWPPERFSAVVDALHERFDLDTALLAGPADADPLAALHGTTSRALPVLSDLPLLVVAAVVRRARAFLGNDSGISHLAGLLGVPTLALFGPTDPAAWSPLGPRVRCIRSQPLADLPVECVLSALASMLDGRGVDHRRE